MRTQILINVRKQITLPINYNHLLVGIIYRFLKESNPEYADFLHETGYHVEKKRFKLFTFSQLMAEQRRILGAEIQFRSPVAWYVSSPVQEFLSHFADTLLTRGSLLLGQHDLRIIDVKIPRTPRFQPEMRFRCLSPIVMSTLRKREDGQNRTHYCLPDDPELSELIRQNLVRKHQAIYGEPPRNDALTFRFDGNYMRRKEGRVTRLIDFKGIKVRGVLCPFSVSGNPALIKIGYECGFGDKNSAGFGMVETL